MFIILVAVLVALALGHLAPAAVTRLRRFAWYAAWVRWLGGLLGDARFWRGRRGIALALLPPLLVVLALQWGLRDGWFGLPGFLFDIFALVYAWGPRNLDVDVEAILDSHDEAARSAAVAQLWPEGYVPSGDGAALVEAVFVAALKRWFGVLLWFLLFGAFGALLFRLVEFSSTGATSALLPDDARDGARKLRAWLEWPTAQLMALALALAGNFEVVRTAWRENGGGNLQSLDTGFLVAAARASVRGELDEDAEEFAGAGLVPSLPELPELRDAMSLIWRVLLIWMAVLAVLVIGGWVS